MRWSLRILIKSFGIEIFNCRKTSKDYFGDIGESLQPPPIFGGNFSKLGVGALFLRYDVLIRTVHQQSTEQMFHYTQERAEFQKMRTFLCRKHFSVQKTPINQSTIFQNKFQNDKHIAVEQNLWFKCSEN